MTASGTWLIFPLTLEGSYRQNLERPAQGPCDTFQYWITPKVGFDVRTFSIDKDIRVLQLDLSKKKEEEIEPTLVDMARRTYEGIIAREVRIEVTADDSVESLTAKVSAVGLFPHVEWTALNFPLWLPEHADYEDQSE
jgi:hypothetical protein